MVQTGGGASDQGGSAPRPALGLDDIGKARPGGGANPAPPLPAPAPAPVTMPSAHRDAHSPARSERPAREERGSKGPFIIALLVVVAVLGLAGLVIFAVVERALDETQGVIDGLRPPTEVPATVAIQRATPEPEATAIGPTPTAVPDSAAEVNGSRYTVLEIRDPSPGLNSLFTPEPGNRWVALHVRQEGTRDGNFYNSFFFRLRDEHGTDHDFALFGAPEPMFGFGMLESGQAVQGWLGFEIPENATITALLARPDPLADWVVIATLSP